MSYSKYKKKAKEVAKEVRKVTGTATARDYNNNFDNTNADPSPNMDFSQMWDGAKRTGRKSFTFKGRTYSTATGEEMNLVKKLKDRRK